MIYKKDFFKLEFIHAHLVKIVIPALCPDQNSMTLYFSVYELNGAQ